MSDFWQGSVATMHLLREESVALHAELRLAAAGRNWALLLPCHAREIDTEVFGRITAQLRETPWLGRIVLGLDQANMEQRNHLRDICSGLPADVLWLDSPEWLETQNALRRAGVELPRRGKGRNVWLSLGWALQHTEAEVFAIHDCDIVAYQSDLLARLIYPVLSEGLPYRFCKGYYPRFTTQFHGRLTRLLFAPLVRCLGQSSRDSRLADFLLAFRYPLAGEVAFVRAVAASFRIASGWALETGMLAEAFRLLPPETICQSGLTASYDHRHHPLLDTNKGCNLREAAEEISAALVSLLGEAAPSTALRNAFLAESAVLCRRYAADSAINSLKYSTETEMAAAEAFADILLKLGSAPQISWLPAWQNLKHPLPGGS